MKQKIMQVLPKLNRCLDNIYKKSPMLNKLHTTYYLILTALVLCLTGISLGIYHFILPKFAIPKTYAVNSLGPKTGVRWIDAQADKMGLRDKEIVLKDAYSTHFKNPDGTVTGLFTGFKQNYEVSPGVWEPIDYSLEKSTDPRYDYQTKNGVGLYLSKNGQISQKNGDSLLESGAPTLGLYNPVSNSFTKLNNLDNPKVNKTDNFLTLDGRDVKLVVYGLDVGAREDLILENPSVVDNANLDDLLTLKAPITTTGKLLLNNHEPATNNYELSTNDTLVLKDQGKTINFPFPEGHDAKDNPATIRRFLIKEGNTWYLYTSVPVSWLKKINRSYPVTVDPDFAGTTADGSVSGGGITYTGARNTADSVGTTQVGATVGQKKVSNTYTVLRSFLEFTTSSIPDSAVINQVNLTMVMITDNSDVDFTTNVVDYNWNANDPLTTSNMEAAYDGCLAATIDNNWKNSSNVVINTQYASANLSTSWITKDTSYGGSTYYCLSSNKDTNNTAPAGREDINLATADNTNATYKPFLTITYQPLAPTASAATSVTDTSFSANWNSQSASGADGYNVLWAAGSTCTTGTTIVTLDVTTTPITGLTGNTQYCFKVRSTDSVGGGTSGWSNIITVTTAPAAPTANPGVAIDSSSSSSGSNVSSLTWSHTVSGANRLLVVGISRRAYGSVSVSSATYNGVALTNSGSVQAGSGDFSRSEIWYLANPNTGTNNIVVTLSGGNDWIEAGAMSFTGVNQTTPLGAFASNSGTSGTSASVNVSSATGDIVIDTLTFWNASLDATKGASQTLRWTVSSDGSWKGRGSTASGGNSVTAMSWTIPTSGIQGWAIGGVAVKSFQNSASQNGFTANWSSSTGATAYKLDVSTVSNFTSYITGLQDLNVGDVTTYSVPNLSCGTSTYYYRVRATNTIGDSSSSGTITVSTSPTVCPSAVSGNVSTVCSCTFTDAFDGLDAGDLSIGASTTLTMNSGKTMVWPPGKKISINGNVIINNTGNMKQGYIVFTDNDNDGIPSSSTPTFSSSAPSGTTKQRSSLASYTTVDCNDNNAAIYQGC